MDRTESAHRVDWILESARLCDDDVLASVGFQAYLNRYPDDRWVVLARRRAESRLDGPGWLQWRRSVDILRVIFAARFGQQGDNDWWGHPYESVADVLLATCVGDVLAATDRDLLSWPWISVVGCPPPSIEKADHIRLTAA